MLSRVEQRMFLTYRRQLYRMLLRASKEPELLPTPEARRFLRDHTRSVFREHRDVRNAAEAQELLQRAHTVLLAIVERAGTK